MTPGHGKEVEGFTRLRPCSSPAVPTAAPTLKPQRPLDQARGTFSAFCGDHIDRRRCRRSYRRRVLRPRAGDRGARPLPRTLLWSGTARQRGWDIGGARTRSQRQRRYSRQVARTARREVIGLLIEKQVTYTEVEADALIAQAKRLANESGRSVRAEAELLLSRNRGTRLRDLQNKVVGASELLAAITAEVDDLRAELGDDDGQLAAIMATMAGSCEPFTSAPAGASTSTTKPGEPPASPVPTDVPGPIESVESPLS